VGVTVEDTLHSQIVKRIHWRYATTRRFRCAGIRLANRTGLPSEFGSWNRMWANLWTAVLKR
jgi:hypothetical protein